MMRRYRMRARSGFSLMEMLIVLVLLMITGGMAMPNVGRMLARTRLQRAANVVANDLMLAHSTAGRQRAPVQITVDATNRVIRVRDLATPTLVFAERRFDATSEYAVQQLTSSAANLTVFPTGLSSGALTITLSTAGRTRTVNMNRAGQIRVQ